jgi:hypothetical protein
LSEIQNRRIIIGRDPLGSGGAKPALAWDGHQRLGAMSWSGARDTTAFLPSSIGAFGPTTPLDNTPQHDPAPSTMYGVPKVAWQASLRLLLQTPASIHGRSYPGSFQRHPPGSNTDCGEIYYEAIKHKKYTL